MQSMPMKHGMRRCDLKRYAKRVLFTLFYFWPEKRLLRPLIGYITH